MRKKRSLVGEASLPITPAAAARTPRTKITPAPKFTSAGDRTGTANRGDSSSKPSFLRPGTQIAQFELIREIGRGGMGRVYLARDTKLGRRVAIKFLALSSQALRERFLVEARTTAQCQHENIVVIHQVDEFQGVPLMVLEHLEGQSLREYSQDRSCTTDQAVDLLVPVVEALVCAHKFGIVHRDLKPDNIFVTSNRRVKVLDFGIARLLAEKERVTASSIETKASAIAGTLPYMAPEQFADKGVDHRADFWALGIIFWELIAGEHPLAPFNPHKLWGSAARLDIPMPKIGGRVSGLHPDLAQLIDQCLQKSPSERPQEAEEILRRLTSLSERARARRDRSDDDPYLGLASFQEADADRFFGRNREVRRVERRLRETPLVCVAAPSGVGKSSLIRAGLIPELKRSGEPWEVMVTRPGRDPLASLASILEPILSPEDSSPDEKANTHRQLLHRLRTEPGFLGTLLRNRARQKKEKILLFVDQFEELYSLVPKLADRQAYTSSLAGVADDASTPLRVVISLRSDFLDRTSEDMNFFDILTNGLHLLPSMGDADMKEAILGPLRGTGYRFEENKIFENMVTSLQDHPSSLPLLQFTASLLWMYRDRARQILTKKAYEDIGGLGGALAKHADGVIQKLSAAQVALARTLFQRLVTGELTRSILLKEEVAGLGDDPNAMHQLLRVLENERLIVAANSEAGLTVELVHESLITEWPTLKRWLSERGEHAAFLEQLGAAARTWDKASRPEGALWRGDALDDAKRFSRRYSGQLAPLEEAYLKAVLALGRRMARRRRVVLAGSFLVLFLVIVGTLLALVSVREQKARAVTEATRAQKAERVVKNQLREIKAARSARDQASAERDAIEKTSNEKIRASYEELLKQKERAERATTRWKKLHAAQKSRADKLARERAKLSTELR